MVVVMKRMDEIRSYDKNPRKNDEAMKYMAESIKQYGVVFSGMHCQQILFFLSCLPVRHDVQ
ncbi:MAG: hypothetical protein IKJ51_05010 [Clostridia bacterium]|nr:hypothetical protein [Clostridia bacterium]MBR6808948.1 hypothetical protein [Clostridia bacterium]